MPINRHPLWRISEWIGIFFYAALIFEMVRLWIAPELDDVERLITLIMLVLFEFIVVHSGVFMAVMPRKWSMLVFIPFYGVFALAFNAAAPGNAILFLYMGIVLMRMRFAFTAPSDEAKTKAIIMSASAAFAYFIFMFIFAIGGGFLPKFGLDYDYLQSSGYFDIFDASGEFVDAPQSPMAMGIAYFSFLIWLEIKVFGLLKPRA